MSEKNSKLKNKKRPNAPGWLITLEGGEGGGKTTQTIRLKNQLTKLGYEVVSLREPGGTSIGEQIRNIVLSSENVDMDFSTEVLLFQAARAQLYQEIVLPSLRAGKVVLMDRSRDSSAAYQGIVRGFGLELIENLNNISTRDTYPDITFLLDLPAEIGLRRRMVSGGLDRLDMESLQFHKQVRQAYLDLANNDNKSRWHVVDASQELKKVTQDIWKVVAHKLKVNQNTMYYDQIT